MADEIPQDYRATLPEDLRGEPMFKDIPDVATLAKVARDAKHALGGTIRPPGPDAGPEARKEFLAKLQKHAPEVILFPEDEKARAEVEDSIWTRLGKPKDAKEYAPPKDVELPEAALEALRAEAAEEGLTKRQFEARAKKAAASLEAATKAQTEARASLKRELGSAYDERIGSAAAAAEKLGFPPGLIAALRDGTVDVATVKALAAVAKGFGEERQVATQGPGASRSTPDEAKSQLAEIRARPEYWDRQKNPALHDQLKARVLELTKSAFPG